MEIIIVIIFILLVILISVSLSFCVEYDGGKSNKIFLRCMCCCQEAIVDRKKSITGDGETFAARCPLCGGTMTNDVSLWNCVVKGEAKENEDRD